MFFFDFFFTKKIYGYSFKVENVTKKYCQLKDVPRL